MHLLTSMWECMTNSGSMIMKVDNRLHKLLGVKLLSDSASKGYKMKNKVFSIIYAIPNIQNSSYCAHINEYLMFSLSKSTESRRLFTNCKFSRFVDANVHTNGGKGIGINNSIQGIQWLFRF